MDKRLTEWMDGREYTFDLYDLQGGLFNEIEWFIFASFSSYPRHSILGSFSE